MAPPHASDESAVSRLTRGLAAGDEAAFREFHTLYFHRLLRCLTVVAHGDEGLARDALQETLVRVARHARRFDEEKAFWDWLTVLGRSAVADGGRKQSRYHKVLALFKPEAPASAPGSDDRLLGALESTLAQLSEPDRDLLHRKYTDRSTAQQIALETGLTEGAVESRLVRIRRELRSRLAQHLRRDD